jgi:hypothetical protein
MDWGELSMSTDPRSAVGDMLSFRSAPESHRALGTPDHAAVCQQLDQSAFHLRIPIDHLRRHIRRLGYLGRLCMGGGVSQLLRRYHRLRSGRDYRIVEAEIDGAAAIVAGTLARFGNEDLFLVRSRVPEILVTYQGR